MKKASVILISILVMTSCATVSDVTTLKRCEFRMQGIKDVVAAGVNISGKKSISELSLLDAGRKPDAQRDFCGCHFWFLLYAGL